MSFTFPVGNFASTSGGGGGGITGIVRPTSSVVTSGTGSITNIANAYDADVTTFATFTDGNNTTPTTYAVLSFSTASLTGSNSIFCRWAYGYPGPNAGAMAVCKISIDSGATYPYSIDYNIGLTGTSEYISGLALPDGVLASNIKVKIYQEDTMGLGLTWLTLYDVYIQ